jgi:hypothetical protein
MSVAAIKNRSHLLDGLLLYSPVLIAILIMLPRLFSPQFGLLDDGKSIVTAQNIARGDWGFGFDSTESRFRPLYWVSFAFLYNVVGEQPIWFFLLNAIVLCLTIVALIAFLRGLGTNPWQAWLAGLFFALSGAIIENFYTLSKGEWLQVMFIIVSLLAIAGYPAALTQRRKILVVAGSSILLVCAMLSKETSVVMLPISAVWAILGWLWAKRAGSNAPGWRIPYLISSAIAAGVYFFLRFLFTTSAVSTSGYTERYTLTISQLVASMVRWAGWLARDYSYLAIILLLVVILLVLRRGFTQMPLVLDMLVWMGAWVVVYLPWNFMTEYYMLPFAFGAACFAGLVLGESIVWHTFLTKVLAGLAVLLLIISSMNNLTTARIQLAVDSVNSQMMGTLANLPPGSIVYLNIQSANEYTDQIEMQLNARFNRHDLTVELFNPETGIPESCPPGACFIVTPLVDNQPLMTVRMGVFEPTQDSWNIALQNYLGKHSKWVKAQDFNDAFKLLTVDFPRLFCAFIETRAFCATSAPLFDNRLFQYDWVVYRLETP